MDILSCSLVNKHFQIGFTRHKRIHALKDITFQVNTKEVFGIIGPNGAGKSSLLKILMGFVKPDNGIITIAGQQPEAVEAHNQIGYLPENPSLYSQLTPREHLKFACRIENITTATAQQMIDHALETVNLTEFADVAIKRFSKGMTQRAALAYAILLNPKLLILDEPMSGLDPFGRQLVVDIIKQYHNQGTTILFCSHILSDIERICDRIGIMHKGKLVSIIKPDELTKSFTPQSTDGKTPLESYFREIIKGHEN